MRKTSTYAKKRAHKDAFALTRHEVINPVTEAVVRQRIEAQVQRLRTDTGLQAYMGDDAVRIANMAWARHPRRAFWLARQTPWLTLPRHRQSWSASAVP